MTHWCGLEFRRCSLLPCAAAVFEQVVVYGFGLAATYIYGHNYTGYDRIVVPWPAEHQHVRVSQATSGHHVCTWFPDRRSGPPLRLPANTVILTQSHQYAACRSILLGTSVFRGLLDHDVDSFKGLHLVATGAATVTFVDNDIAVLLADLIILGVRMVVCLF